MSEIVAGGDTTVKPTGAYAATVITDAGLRLNAKIQAGGLPLDITRVAMGSGVPPEGVTAEIMTALIHEEINARSLSVTRTSDYEATITSIFDNNDLDHGFDIHEIGVMANDPDDGEILYAVILANGRPNFFDPTNDGSILQITHAIRIKVSRTTDVFISNEGMTDYIGRDEFESFKEHDHDGGRGGEKIKGKDIDGPVSEALRARDPVEGYGIDKHIKDNLRHVHYAALTGTAEAYTGAYDPAPTALAEGMQVTVKPHVDCAAGATLDLNGLGAKPLLASDGTAATASLFKAGQPYLISYTAAGWRLISGGSDWINPLPNVNGTWYRGDAPPTGDMRANYSGDIHARSFYGKVYLEE